MRLNTKEALGAISTALLAGAADYQNNAAHQSNKGNQDGVEYAISRAVFLRAVFEYINGLADDPEINQESDQANLLTFDQLGDLTAVAGARVRGVVEYDATKPGEAQVAVARSNRLLEKGLDAEPLGPNLAPEAGQ